MFDRVKHLVDRNPVQQFAKRAARPDLVSLTSSGSPTALGSGLDQNFIGVNQSQHAKIVQRNSTFFNMMRFKIKTPNHL